jgi:hypothetical protein
MKNSIKINILEILKDINDLLVEGYNEAAGVELEKIKSIVEDSENL